MGQMAKQLRRREFNLTFLWFRLESLVNHTLSQFSPLICKTKTSVLFALVCTQVWGNFLTCSLLCTSLTQALKYAQLLSAGDWLFTSDPTKSTFRRGVRIRVASLQLLELYGTIPGTDLGLRRRRSSAVIVRDTVNLHLAASLESQWNSEFKSLRFNVNMLLSALPQLSLAITLCERVWISSNLKKLWRGAIRSSLLEEPIVLIELRFRQWGTGEGQRSLEHQQSGTKIQ